MAKIFKIILFFLLAKFTFATENRPMSLNEVVLRRANLIFREYQEKEIPLHIGRKSILRQMQLFPAQLSVDLKRLQHIRIGGQTIKSGKNNPMAAERQFLFLAHTLELYVHRKANYIRNKNITGRLGEFFTTEIIYIICQNFSGPSVEMALLNPKLADPSWVSHAGETKHSAFFNLSSSSILEVTLYTQKIYEHIENKRLPKKIVNLSTTVFFDLESGEVAFNYFYDIDGQGCLRVRQIFD
jgi:hypothetical protein